MMKSNKLKKGLGMIRPVTFFPPFIALVILAFYSLTAGLQNEEAFVDSLSSIFNGTLDNFGWLYNLVAVAILVFVVFLAFSRFGKIKFGGKDAKPEFTYWNWFAMTL